jgi:hypothetical protein
MKFSFSVVKNFIYPREGKRGLEEYLERMKEKYLLDFNVANIVIFLTKGTSCGITLIVYWNYL